MQSGSCEREEGIEIKEERRPKKGRKFWDIMIGEKIEWSEGHVLLGKWSHPRMEESQL